MWKDARLRLGSLVAEGFFNGVAYAGSLHPSANLGLHGVEKLSNIPYCDDENPAHRLDVYRPVSGEQVSPPRAVVLYIHGGGFRILSKDTHWLMALAYARRGYVVFNVNYRLAQEARYPGAVADVCDAYAWVRAHAAEYGGDPDRMILAGESAGANLAVALTTALCWRREEPYAASLFDAGRRPLAVVPVCGVFQVSDIERLPRRKAHMSTFVADRLREVTDAYLGPDAPAPGDPALDFADPAVHYARAPAPDRPLPPFFLAVGTRDPLLPDTRRLADALVALGAVVHTQYYPGEIHAFHAFVFREQARLCWQHTFEFLALHAPITPSGAG